MLGDRRLREPLPAELASAVREWRAVAASVLRSGGAAEQELVRRRGRQLAARIADALGRPVDFIDPVTGAVESIAATPTVPMPRLAREPPGPTPWATGLVISAYAAVLVAIANIALSQAFAEAFGLLWAPANLLIGVGLAPSLYLLRSRPFWRWPALGTAAGLVAAWLVLLLDLLG